MIRRTLLALAAGCLVASHAGVALAGAVVSTTIVSGNHQLAGSTLKVKVYVSSSDLPDTAQNRIRANAFRISYNSNYVTLTSVKTQADIPPEAGDLGSATLGPIGGISPNIYRTAANDGTGSPASPLTPDIYTLIFTVVNPYPGPYSITVADDPNQSLPLLAESLAHNVPHTFDNSGTTNLGLIPAPAVTDWTLHE